MINDSFFLIYTKKFPQGCDWHFLDLLSVDKHLETTLYIYQKTPQPNIILFPLDYKQSYKIDLFTENMISLEHKLDRFQGGCLVMGDFNEDIFKTSFAEIMEEKGYST